MIVDPAIFEGQYPSRVGKGEIIVLLDNDPLQGPYQDRRWSCVLDRADVDVVSIAPTP